MAAVLYEPAFVIVATWFRRDRNKALAVNAEVGRRLSTILDQSALVSAVVEQVQLWDQKILKP